MVKQRIIFSLFFSEGYYYLSRNFTLQKVGELSWLIDKFKFHQISEYIDELVIYDVSRNREKGFNLNLLQDVAHLQSFVFLPITVGGGISSTTEIEKCFREGVDKIIFSSQMFDKPELVKETIDKYGSQAVICQIDYKLINSNRFSFIYNGQKQHLSLKNHFEEILNFDVGEIILNSIDRDGTGFGFDIEVLKFLDLGNKTLIISGGAGKPDHFCEALNYSEVNAAATGDLFNFLGNGFLRVRQELIKKGMNVRKLDIDI